MQELAKPGLKDQLDAVHMAVFGWPLDQLSPTAELLSSASLQEATRKLLMTERARTFLNLETPSFLALDMKSQLDIVHTAIFGWALDHLSETDYLLSSATLQEATHRLVDSQRARSFMREAIPVWPVDKWVCTEYFDLRIWVNLNDSYVALGVLNDNWENNEVAFVLDNLSPGDAMIDVGANVGVYTLQAARKVGPAGKVYAFEPQTDIGTMLARSIAENGFDDRCVLHNFALGDRDGMAAVWRHHGSNPGASIITAEEILGESGNATSLKRLDSMTFERPIKLLKMDIEGYEPLLVAGGQQFFREHHPIIITEWFPRSMQQVAGLSSEHYFRELTALDYRVHFLDGKQVGGPLTEDRVREFDNIGEPFNIVCIPL